MAAIKLVAGLCLAAAPSAQALSFTSGSLVSNPFFYDPPSSNWNLIDGGDASASVTLQENETSIVFSSSGEGTDTFTTNRAADQIYTISFSYDYIPDPDTTGLAFYQICSTSNCLGSERLELGEENSITPFSLNSGQYLRFAIDNTDGGGNLTISNFNATPAPSPLPFAGLGLAALGIYRARRKAATPK